MTTSTVQVSDLSGAQDAEQVRLGYAGREYEIDLTVSEREDLEALIDPYLRAGRRARKPAKRRHVPQTTREERGRIRVWAQAEGLQLAERGQIPNHIVRAFENAHALKMGS